MPFICIFIHSTHAGVQYVCCLMMKNIQPQLIVASPYSTASLQFTV